MCQKKEKIDVSIICLTYNHEKYIRQALDSILTQETQYKYEILVGEDHSPDKSKKILKEYEQRYPDKFKIYYREKNLGITKNLYDLFMHANGRYIANLELDDYWTDRHKLQKQISFLDNHLEYMGCVHEFMWVNKYNEKLFVENRLKEFYNQRITLNDFLMNQVLFQTATFIYRNIWKEEKDYSVIYKAHNMVGDFTVTSIILSRGDIFVLSDCMSAYRYVIDEAATSASAVFKREPALTLTKALTLLLVLERYFEKKVKFSYRKEELLSSYLMGVIKREQGYHIKEFLKMFLSSGVETHKLFYRHILKKCKVIK